MVLETTETARIQVRIYDDSQLWPLLRTLAKSLTYC